MSNSLQRDFTSCASQYEFNSFVTMETYWVPDLPDNEGFFGHPWHSVLISINGASSAWSSKHINMLGLVRGLVNVFRAKNH